jgi:hypothetical protein
LKVFCLPDFPIGSTGDGAIGARRLFGRLGPKIKMKVK